MQNAVFDTFDLLNQVSSVCRYIHMSPYYLKTPVIQTLCRMYAISNTLSGFCNYSQLASASMP